MLRRAVVVSPKTSPPAEEAAPSGASLFEGVPGASATFRWQGERIHYRCMGYGPPLVLVHAPDVGGSCIEWRRNIEPLAAVFSVFAVDLPGYGLSDIHARPYTAEVYIDFLGEFLRKVCEPGTRVAGCVQSASYLVHAGVRWPSQIARLLLIAPSGISSHQPGTLGTAGFVMRHLPGLASALYGTATSRFAILEHLQNEVYADEAHAGPHAVDTRFWVCHREHAECVERSRAAGLQNVELRQAWPKLHRPAMLIWGRAAANPPLTDADTLLAANRGTKLTVFDHSALAPHEEEPHRFNQLAMSFLADGLPSHTSP